MELISVKYAQHKHGVHNHHPPKYVDCQTPETINHLSKSNGKKNSAEPNRLQNLLNLIPLYEDRNTKMSNYLKRNDEIEEQHHVHNPVYNSLLDSHQKEKDSAYHDPVF